MSELPELPTGSFKASPAAAGAAGVIIFNAIFVAGSKYLRENIIPLQFRCFYFGV